MPEAEGTKVVAHIRKEQRRKLQRALEQHEAPCASRTWHSDGHRILAAIREQHRRGK